MLNLLNFLWRYYAFFLFIILEILALSLVVSNGHQSAVFAYTSNQIGGNAFSSWQSIVQYFNLKEANIQLVEENNHLRSQLKESYLDRVDKAFEPITIADSLLWQDSLHPSQNEKPIQIENFEYLGAKVISNSIHKQKNYLMLNMGKRQGIKENMGVIGPQGAVGIVYSVSDDFSTAISLLNIKTQISAKLKANNELGSLKWDGSDPNSAQLYSIETYIPIHVGDTLITSGFSHIFPENILLGTIEDYHKTEGSNTYTISIKLQTDFSNLQFVSIVRNKFYEEQLLLRKTWEDKK